MLQVSGFANLQQGMRSEKDIVRNGMNVKLAEFCKKFNILALPCALGSENMNGHDTFTCNLKFKDHVAPVMGHAVKCCGFG